MGSGRAYSKSGSIEKYESSQWSTPTWSSSSAKGTVSTPDSNGNYTVSAPSGYKESTTGGTVTCTTHYGGVAKVFYFVPNTTTPIKIYFNVTLFIGAGAPYIYAEMGLSSNTLPCDVLITAGITDKSIYESTILYCNVVFSTGEIATAHSKPIGINHGNVELTTAQCEPKSYKDSNGNRYDFSVTFNTQP